MNKLQRIHITIEREIEYPLGRLNHSTRLSRLKIELPGDQRMQERKASSESLQPGRIHEAANPVP